MERSSRSVDPRLSDDEGIQAAKDFLRGRLEDLFEETSKQYIALPAIYPESEDEEEIIKAWREGSVVLITDVFGRLMAALEPQDRTASIRMAKGHVWEVINEFFGWKSDNHSDWSVLFKWIGEVKHWERFAAHLNSQFWERFDKVLRDLGNDARSRPIAAGLDGTAAAGTAFSDLYATARPTDQVRRTEGIPEPENKFVKEGTTWEIVYAGKTCRVGASMLGFEYIAVLLQHPGAPMAPLELQGLAGGVSLNQSYREVAKLSIQENASDDEPSDDSSTVGRDDRVDVTYDEQTEGQGQARLQEIENRLTALGNLHTPEAADLQKEYDDIKSYLDRSKNFQHQPRPINDPNENARSSITKALGRAYKMIEDQAPETAAHLRSSIETGSKFEYGDKSVHWRVSRRAQAHKPSASQSLT